MSFFQLKALPGWPVDKLKSWDCEGYTVEKLWDDVDNGGSFACQAAEELLRRQAAGLPFMPDYTTTEEEK